MQIHDWTGTGDAPVWDAVRNAGRERRGVRNGRHDGGGSSRLCPGFDGQRVRPHPPFGHLLPRRGEGEERSCRGASRFFPLVRPSSALRGPFSPEGRRGGAVLSGCVPILPLGSPLTPALRAPSPRRGEGEERSCRGVSRSFPFLVRPSSALRALFSPEGRRGRRWTRRHGFQFIHPARSIPAGFRYRGAASGRRRPALRPSPPRCERAGRRSGRPSRAS